MGSISTSYIITKLHMNQIACVESEFIVPGVIYAEGKLRHPFRLYSNEKGDICVLVCEAPVMIQGMYSGGGNDTAVAIAGSQGNLSLMQ